MGFPRPDSIIEQLLTEFLADHEAQLSPEGDRRYAYILDLLKLFLERHRPGRRRRECGPRAHPDGPSCGLPGAADLTRGRSKFLGDFLPREMAVDAETLQVARAVIQKLGVWLAAKGYVPRG
jgi:hypothetical protein